MHAITDNTSFLAKPSQIGAQTFTGNASCDLDGFAIFRRDFQVTMEPAPHTPLSDMTAVFGGNRPSQGTLATSDINCLLEGSCIHGLIIQLRLCLSTSSLV